MVEIHLHNKKKIQRPRVKEEIDCMAFLQAER